MSQVKSVGLLTSRNHPLLPYFLDIMETIPDVEPVLIFDEKDFSAKDKRIFAERTEGAFPDRDIAPFLSRYRWATVPDHNGQECQIFVKRHALGLLMNAGTPRIIKPGLIETAAIGILNAHPGILPKYRGASCCEWAIYHDDPVGVTAHFMDAGIDSGPILFSRELPIRRGQTYIEVRVALYRLAHEVRVEAIRKTLEEEIAPDGLPSQPEVPVFRPISEDFLKVVKEKLASGEYRCAL